MDESVAQNFPADATTTEGEVFVSRRPIFDRQMEVFGYELDFRSDFETYYQQLDADTAAVDFMAFINFGELSDGRRGLVTFSRYLLMRGFPALLPRETTTVVLGPDVRPDEAVITACQKLKGHGYQLALGELDCEDLDNALLELVDIVQVDFASRPPEQCQQIAKALAQRGVQALGRNLNASSDYDKASSWGYELFHGEFFSRPSVKTDKELSPNKVNYLRLLDKIGEEELSYDETAGIIQQDVALVYRLLKFMNSAWFGLRYQIHSVKHALVMLGPAEIRRWVSMFILRELSEDKPKELLTRSLVRGKTAEQTAPLVGLRKHSSELFLMGMFSVIDALTDQPMKDILAGLPLTEDIKTALLGGSGKFTPVYNMILSYEQGDWQAFSVNCGLLHLDETRVPELFRAGLKWANTTLEQM